MVESITGHLSRRMLEHYSHIRLSAKKAVLDRQNERPKGDKMMNERAHAVLEPGATAQVSVEGKISNEPFEEWNREPQARSSLNRS